MSNSNELFMTFDPKTIEHLGLQMYSTLPPVIAEVVANAYDADAENVRIYLEDIEQKSITVTDDGHGMPFIDINDKFLAIGRNRRKEGEGDRSPIKHRAVIGKKGIGKLSFFGIARRIEVETIQDKKKNAFALDWNDLMKSKGIYKPEILIPKDTTTREKNGTRVMLSVILRKSPFDPKNIAISLSRLFSVFGDDFIVKIVYNKDEDNAILVTNELKYEYVDEELSWKFPVANKKFETDYQYQNDIKGNIVSSKKTIPEVMRGIALFSRGKLVNDHSFYTIKATSLGYSYITGWLDVSFIDDWKEKDVIATNRRSLRMEDEDVEDLVKFIERAITSFYYKQREVRREKRIIQIEESGIKTYDWIKQMPN